MSAPVARAPGRDAQVAARGPGVLALAALLLRARLWQLRGGILRAPRASRSRVLALAALLVPLSTLGLWSAAFVWLGRAAGPESQAAALALAVVGLVLSGLLGKLASGDLLPSAAPAGPAQSPLAFLLARPVTLARLATARALAAAVLDPWGGLFLLPVLAVAALHWRLGAAGLAAALAASLCAQATLVALAQAGQILLAHTLARRWPRAVPTLLALAAAAGVAALWILASALLQRTDALVAQLAPRRALLLHSPVLAPLAAPARLVAALAGVAGATRAPVAAAALVATALAALGLAYLAGRWAERRAYPLDAEAARAPRARRVDERGPPLSLAMREWLALRRDPARLVSLLALPALFLAVQGALLAGGGPAPAAVPGSGTATRAMVIAYSLCAYLAAFAPLGHMQRERATWWLLRATPRSPGALLLDKARAWAVLLPVVGTVAFLLLAWLGTGRPPSPGVLLAGAARVAGGAALLAFLAIGMGAAAADLSRPERGGLPAGTVYAFLLVAGLLNLVLLDPGGAWPALPLAGATAALTWQAGVARAERCLDPDAELTGTPAAAAASAMLAALLWYLGARAAHAAPRAGASPAEAAALELGVALSFLAVLALARARAGWRRLRGRSGGAHAARVPTARVLGRAGMTLLAALAGALVARTQPSGWFAGPPVDLAALSALGLPARGAAVLAALALVARELVLRGGLQRALHELHAGPGAAPLRIAAVAGTSLLVAVLASGAPTWASLAQHAVATALFALTRSVWPGCALGVACLLM